MKRIIILGLGVMILAGCSSSTPTRTTEQAYMIIDVKGDSSIREDVLTTVIQTAQENMSELRVNKGLPPSVIPETAARFELVDPFKNSPMSGMLGGFSMMSQASGGASIKVPSCKDPLLTMKSDSTTSGWDEKTSFFICVVQYKEGYHVDVYTTFEKQSGGYSMDALSKSLASSLVGDTSQKIPQTMSRLKTALSSISADTKIADSYIPTNWKGAFSNDVETLTN